MRPLSAPELLHAWERGRAQGSVERALTVLSVACPDVPSDTLARLTIGQRDGCLLTLREWAFGPHITGLATCPNCGERLEVAFDAADIRLTSQQTWAESEAELSLASEGYTVRFRLPNSLDLQAASGCGDETQARRCLLQRCVLSIHVDAGEGAIDDLPPQVVDAVVARMADADPQADVQLAMSCPVCQHEWLAAFDILSFFWTEIEAWIQRTLRQVHVLASAYGWREADILVMSPWRRQQYLEMVGRGA